MQPTIASRYKYPVESHTAVTKDKYVLEMHRIPHGKDEDPPPEGSAAAPRPVVFIQHGLLTSSADFSIAGPGKALGEQGGLFTPISIPLRELICTSRSSL